MDIVKKKNISTMYIFFYFRKVFEILVQLKRSLHQNRSVPTKHFNILVCLHPLCLISITYQILNRLQANAIQARPLFSSNINALFSFLFV